MLLEIGKCRWPIAEGADSGAVDGKEAVAGFSTPWTMCLGKNLFRPLARDFQWHSQQAFNGRY